MKIAAIDVGTNSFHLLIGQVSADGQVVPIERAKDMVRLGDSAFGTGVISAEAFARASEALRNFKRLAERHHCDGIVAAATSATREADNGGDFVRAMHRMLQTDKPEDFVVGTGIPHTVRQLCEQAFSVRRGDS